MIGINVILTGMVVFVSMVILSNIYEAEKEDCPKIIIILGLCGVAAIPIGLIMWIWGV